MQVTDGQSHAGIGVIPKAFTATVWNRTGATLTVGELVMVDEKGSDAATSKTQTNPGADDYPVNNVITPTTAGIGAASADTGHRIGVVISLGTAGTGADDTKVVVAYAGLWPVKAANTAASGEYGKLIFPANSVRTFDTTGTTIARRALGRLRTDATTANSNALVEFYGWAGMGATYAN